MLRQWLSVNKVFEVEGFQNPLRKGVLKVKRNMLRISKKDIKAKRIISKITILKLLHPK
jgi:hypothetical protein